MTEDADVGGKKSIEADARKFKEARLYGGFGE